MQVTNQPSPEPPPKPKRPVAPRNKEPKVEERADTLGKEQLMHPETANPPTQTHEVRGKLAQEFEKSSSLQTRAAQTFSRMVVPLSKKRGFTPLSPAEKDRTRAYIQLLTGPSHIDDTKNLKGEASVNYFHSRRKAEAEYQGALLTATTQQDFDVANNKRQAAIQQAEIAFEDATKHKPDLAEASCQLSLAKYQRSLIETHDKQEFLGQVKEIAETKNKSNTAKRAEINELQKNYWERYKKANQAVFDLNDKYVAIRQRKGQGMIKGTITKAGQDAKLRASQMTKGAISKPQVDTGSLEESQFGRKKEQTKMDLALEVHLAAPDIYTNVEQMAEQWERADLGMAEKFADDLSALQDKLVDRHDELIKERTELNKKLMKQLPDQATIDQRANEYTGSVDQASEQILQLREQEQTLTTIDMINQRDQINSQLLEKFGNQDKIEELLNAKYLEGDDLDVADKINKLRTLRENLKKRPSVSAEKSQEAVKTSLEEVATKMKEAETNGLLAQLNENKSKIAKNIENLEKTNQAFNSELRVVRTQTVESQIDALVADMAPLTREQIDDLLDRMTQINDMQKKLKDVRSRKGAYADLSDSQLKQVEDKFKADISRLEDETYEKNKEKLTELEYWRSQLNRPTVIKEATAAVAGQNFVSFSDKRNLGDTAHIERPFRPIGDLPETEKAKVREEKAAMQAQQTRINKIIF